VTIWVVRAGDDLYIRSACGSDNPWYRHAIKSGEGRIRAGGVEKDATFAGASGDDPQAIDHSYHAKYDQYGPAIVGSVTGAHAHDLTIRLVPNDAAPDPLVPSVQERLPGPTGRTKKRCEQRSCTARATSG